MGNRVISLLKEVDELFSRIYEGKNKQTWEFYVHTRLYKHHETLKIYMDDPFQWITGLDMVWKMLRKYSKELPPPSRLTGEMREIKSIWNKLRIEVMELYSLYPLADKECVHHWWMIQYDCYLQGCMSEKSFLSLVPVQTKTFEDSIKLIEYNRKRKKGLALKMQYRFTDLIDRSTAPLFDEVFETTVSKAQALGYQRDWTKLLSADLHAFIHSRFRKIKPKDKDKEADLVSSYNNARYIEKQYQSSYRNPMLTAYDELMREMFLQLQSGSVRKDLWILLNEQEPDLIWYRQVQGIFDLPDIDWDPLQALLDSEG